MQDQRSRPINFVIVRIVILALAALPWEFLCDPDESEFICLSSTTPIVRYLGLAQPPRPLLVTPPLYILAMTSSPKDLPELDIEREKLRRGPNNHQPKMPYSVTLSAAKGLSQWTSRCFAALSRTGLSSCRAIAI